MEGYTEVKKYQLSVAIIVVAFLCLLALVGKLSFDDEVLNEQRYCQMVLSGAWGAYKETVNCEKE